MEEKGYLIVININENVLMCQTGYLTLKSDLNPARAAVLLGLANREVAAALSRLLRLACVFSAAASDRRIIAYQQIV